MSTHAFVDKVFSSSSREQHSPTVCLPLARAGALAKVEHQVLDLLIEVFEVRMVSTISSRMRPS
ncbi:hypothetical protein ACXX9E_28595 [Pseudomonas sp. GNP014]